MGTSSSNGGPSGITSLYPTWYNNGNTGAPVLQPGGNSGGGEGESGEDSGSPQTVPQAVPDAAPPLSGNWKDAKIAFTRYSKKTGGSSIRKAARSYVGTLGGSRGATRSASRGISSGRSLAGFLSGVSSAGGGLNETLKQLGLSNFIGRSSEEILARIADAIAPTGATNDEAIARDSVIATLDQLYTTLLENGGDITTLESLTPEMIKGAVIDFASIYIFKKWVYELGLAIEKNTISERQAIAMEVEIKDFIHGEVKLALRDKEIREFNLDTSNNQQIIQSIFQTAYSTLEK